MGQYEEPVSVLSLYNFKRRPHGYGQFLRKFNFSIPAGRVCEWQGFVPEDRYHIGLTEVVQRRFRAFASRQHLPFDDRLRIRFLTVSPLFLYGHGGFATAIGLCQTAVSRF